jgi:asparagine synthase (glutamine-hydrolysing)
VLHHARALQLRRRWPRLVRQGLHVATLLASEPMHALRALTTHSWASDGAQLAVSEALAERVAQAAGRGLSALGPARQAMAADRLTRLSDAMLAKVDIASMAASIEVRVPLLDDALVRFADRVPEHQLVGVRCGKVLLRRVLARVFPGRLAWQRKRGFAVPLAGWMHDPDTHRRLTALFAERHALLEQLTGVAATRAWDRFNTSGANAAPEQILWLASVALWADRFGVTDARRPELDALPIA